MSDDHIVKQRWPYYETEEGWDVHITPPYAPVELVLNFNCSRARIKLVSRASELANALTKMRLDFATKRHRKIDTAPYFRVTDDLPSYRGIREEPRWGIEHFQWGQPRFIFAFGRDSEGESLPPHDSTRIVDDYNLRWVDPRAVSNIVRSRQNYRMLLVHLERLGFPAP